MNLVQSKCVLTSGAVAQEKKETPILTTMNKMLAGAMAIQKVCEISRKHGANGICAGVTLATGIGFIAQGNYCSGAITSLAGLKGVLDIWRKCNPTNELSSLLNDADSGIKMVQTLQQTNDKSFDIVNSNLDIIHDNMNKMNHSMQKINNIASKGNQEIEDLKSEATAYYNEAKKQFDVAKTKLEKSQNSFKAANEIFERSFKYFDQLFQLGNTADISDAQKVKRFIKTAERIQRRCLKAQEKINRGNEEMQVGLKAFNFAIEKELEASERISLAVATVKNKLDLIALQAQVKVEYEKKVDETKDELKDIQARNQDIKKLMDEIAQDVRDANQLSEEKFGTTSILLGVVPGTVAGFSVAGLKGALVGGMAGGHAVHHREKIINRIDIYFNGKENFIDANPNKQEFVKLKFRDRSTGWFNRFVKREKQSYTVGKAEILIGKEVFSYDFNLNKEYKMNKQDLYQLQQVLGKKIISKEISPQQCLNIIAELTSKHIDRGSRHSSQQGFVAKNSPYLCELQRICANMVALETNG